MPSTGIIAKAIPEIDTATNHILSDPYSPNSPQEISPEYPSNTVPIIPEPSFSVSVMGGPSGPISAESLNSSELLSGRPKSSIHSQTLHKEDSEKTEDTAIDVDGPNRSALKRIWCTYAREAHAFDQQMIFTWNKTLDVRLLFSGIFSAIVTPFILESYKLLEAQQPSPPFFGSDGYKVRVNAMWFSSLIISLVAALLSIHCKQWLDGYGVDLVFAGAASGCPESLAKACRLRQYRYQGLHVFGIPSVIDMLPVLIYTSLALFIIGLIDFLWHLNEVIAIYISGLCGVVVVAHVGSTLVPCFTTASPFKTPLSNFLGNMSRKVRGGEPLEKEEMNDVRNRKDFLDEIGYKWLMEHTRSEEVYMEAYNAYQEYLDFRELSKAKPVPGQSDSGI